jgi:putative transposase
MFVTIQGEQQYLWLAVDQGGNVIDLLMQRRRNRRTAERFFRRHLKGKGRELR